MNGAGNAGFSLALFLDGRVEVAGMEEQESIRRKQHELEKELNSESLWWPGLC